MKERQGGLQRKPRLTDKQRFKALFSGLLKCGCCGGGFTKISLHHYGCFVARKKALCDNWNTIRQDEVEHAVLYALKQHLMQPELCEAFCKEYARHMNQLRMAHNAQKQNYETELKKRTRESERLLRMVMDWVTTGAVVKDTLNAHTARIS